MTRREKKLVAAVIITLTAALGMAVWMQRREHFVEEVLRDFAGLDYQLESVDPEGIQARRLKETRPRIQNLILARRYHEAREEFDALQKTAHTEQISLLKLDRSLTANQLFPPDSQERERAYKLLVDLVEKEKAGFDTEAVRAELARMGGQALRGERDLCLQTLARAEKALQQAQRIPGFEQLSGPSEGPKPPLALSGPLGPGPRMNLSPRTLKALPGASLSPGARSSFQALPPRLQHRLRELGLRLVQAHQQGLDLTPLQPQLQELDQAVQRGQTGRIGRLIRQIEKAIQALAARSPPHSPKPAPKEGAAEPVKPSLPVPPSSFPAPPELFLPLPESPGKEGEPLPAPNLTPMIMAALDRIRDLSAEEYRQQRPHIAQMLGQLLQKGVGPGLPFPSPGEGETLPIPPASEGKSVAPPPASPEERAAPAPGQMVLKTPSGLTLELSAQGSLTAMRIGSIPLPLRPDPLSGFCLESLSGELLPLAGTVETRGLQATQRARETTTQVELRAVYAAGKNGLSIRARLAGWSEDLPGLRLSYRLPLDAVGWRWIRPSPRGSPASPGEELRAGQIYSAQRRKGRLLQADLVGPRARLHWETKDPSAELVYDAENRVLSISFPLPESSSPAVAEVAFRVEVSPLDPSPEPAG